MVIARSLPDARCPLIYYHIVHIQLINTIIALSGSLVYIIHGVKVMMQLHLRP